MAAPRTFTRTVSSLYPVYQRPPIVPPQPTQETAASLAKSTGQHHQHSRQATSTATASTSRQPAATATRPADRRGDPLTPGPIGPTSRPDGRRYSRRGGEVCGYESARFF